MKIVEKNKRAVIYSGSDFSRDLEEVFGEARIEKGGVLLVTGEKSFDQSFYKKEFLALLKKLNLTVCKRIRTSANPDLFSFKKELDDLDCAVDWVFCVGGGSVIDYGKLVKLKKFKEAKIFVLYTLPGSGSIVTPFAIYGNEEFKIGDHSENIIPDVVYANKKVIEDLSQELRLIAVCDIYAHAMESLLSKAKTEESGRFSKEALDILSKKQEIEKMNAEEFLEADIAAAKAESIALVLFPHAIGHYLTYKLGVPHPIASIVFFQEFIELLISKGVEVDVSHMEYLLELKKLLKEKGLLSEHYEVEAESAMSLIEKYMGFVFDNSPVPIPRKEYLRMIKK